MSLFHVFSIVFTRSILSIAPTFEDSFCFVPRIVLLFIYLTVLSSSFIIPDLLIDITIHPNFAYNDLGKTVNQYFQCISLDQHITSHF